MRHIAYFSLTICLLTVCVAATPKPISLVGTWELISATSTEGTKTTSTFDPNRKMIKIINVTHFAFLNHDLRTGKDTTIAPFNGGGGRYTLVGNVYTEYLEYFSDRQWEGNKFEFTVGIVNDTLIQQGVEKVEKLGIDHIIVEKYRRVTK